MVAHTTAKLYGDTEAFLSFHRVFLQCLTKQFVTKL